MEKRFLVLKNTAGGAPAFFAQIQKHQIDFIQQYEADRLDWFGYDAILITMHCDHHHLMEHRERFEAYMEQGGTVMFNGHVVHSFLPELRPFEVLPRCSKVDLMVNRESDHPVFDGIDGEMLSARKGVSGFYGRGMNPPPQGALVLNSISEDRWPLDWISTRASGGRVFMHAGNDIWSYFMVGAPQNLPLVQRLFDWLGETSNLAPHPSAAE